MARPQVVGDLISLVVTFTPPEDDPTAEVTACSLLIRKPDGTELTPVAGVELSSNVWRLRAVARCDVSGTWYVRVNANGGLIDSIEMPLRIEPTAFATPLP